MPILKWKNRITKSGSYYSLIVLPLLSNMPVTLKQFKEIIFRLSLPYPETLAHIQSFALTKLLS